MPNYPNSWLNILIRSWSIITKRQHRIFRQWFKSVVRNLVWFVAAFYSILGDSQHQVASCSAVKFSVGFSFAVATAVCWSKWLITQERIQRGGGCPAPPLQTNTQNFRRVKVIYVRRTIWGRDDLFFTRHLTLGGKQAALNCPPTFQIPGHVPVTVNESRARDPLVMTHGYLAGADGPWLRTPDLNSCITLHYHSSAYTFIA